MSGRNRYGRLDGHAGRRRRDYVLERQKYLCATPGCHGIAEEADHIRPLFQGGADTLENLQGLCKSCHASKTAKERKIWAARPRKKRRKGIAPEWRALIDSLIELHH